MNRPTQPAVMRKKVDRGYGFSRALEFVSLPSKGYRLAYLPG